MDEARLEIGETRSHLHETAEELGAALSQRANAAKERVNPMHYAREYPWAALGLAVGVGLAVGIAGADRKAAAAIASGASAAKDKIAERFSGDGDEAVKIEPVAETEPKEPSLRQRITGQIDSMLADGLREFMASVNGGSNPATRPSDADTSAAATRSLL